MPWICGGSKHASCDIGCGIYLSTAPLWVACCTEILIDIVLYEDPHIVNAEPNEDPKPGRGPQTSVDNDHKYVSQLDITTNRKT